jgi:hypothetical protein
MPIRGTSAAQVNRSTRILMLDSRFLAQQI